MNLEETRFAISNSAKACKSCGKKVLFVTDENGVKQILDLVAPVFTVDSDGSRLIVTRKPLSYVSHFATCPQATGHSKKNEPSGSGSSGGDRYEIDVADVRELLDADECFTDWERSFLESAARWVIEDEGLLSEKQRKVVNRMLRKARGER